MSENVHDPEFLTLAQGHQEKWIKKSCVSFEEECISEGLFLRAAAQMHVVP